MPYQEELAKLYSQTVRRATQKERELLRLIQVKAEKLANNYLMEHEHTQLSYLPEEQREAKIALPKEMLLNKIITYLKSI